MLQNTRLLTAGVAVVAAAALAGCGQSEPDLVNGKKKFIGKCSSCHTLARAGGGGNQGPNLDNAFANARRNGFGDSGIAGVTRNQITTPRRGSIMAADLVTGDDKRDVAAYVGKVAGKGGEDTGLLATAGTPDYSNRTATPKAGKLTIPADPGGSLAFTFGKATAKPGPVTVEMPNPSSVPHNIALRGPVTGKGAVVGKDGNSSFQVTLKAGNYTFVCEVQGHEDGGMKGTLVVK